MQTFGTEAKTQIPAEQRTTTEADTIAEAKITGMCIDDEGLRLCLNMESDDADFIREYGVLYSYNYGARWFHKRDKASRKLTEMRIEAELADKFIHEWYDTPQHKLN